MGSAEEDGTTGTGGVGGFGGGAVAQDERGGDTATNGQTITGSLARQHDDDGDGVLRAQTQAVDEPRLREDAHLPPEQMHAPAKPDESTVSSPAGATARSGGIAGDTQVAPRSTPPVQVSRPEQVTLTEQRWGTQPSATDFAPVFGQEHQRARQHAANRAARIAEPPAASQPASRYAYLLTTQPASRPAPYILELYLTIAPTSDSEQSAFANEETAPPAQQTMQIQGQSPSSTRPSVP